MEQLTFLPRLADVLTLNAADDTLKLMGLKAAGYITNSKSLNTQCAYAGDWFRFSSWCRQHGLSALPAKPSTVALYISDLADRLKVSSILRNIAVISKGHQLEGYPSPCSLQHAVPLVINQIVKRCCERAGLDPDRFGAHSLRSGMCTQAARNGVSERSIMLQSGHRTVTTLRRYIHEGELFQHNAASRLGL